MSIDYGVEQLTAATRALATGSAPLAERLQAAWTDHVQNLWAGVFLPDELNERFRLVWDRYTARQADDPQSSTLRELSEDEQRTAVEDVLGLMIDAVAARAAGATPGRGPAAR